jgi:hypothetical protein
MTPQQPTPEAVEAVARLMNADMLTRDEAVPWDKMGEQNQQWWMRDADVMLCVVRDAIHRDGDDADAIRHALGLHVETERHTAWRRVVGEWQEVQP